MHCDDFILEIHVFRLPSIIAATASRDSVDFLDRVDGEDSIVFTVLGLIPRRLPTARKSAPVYKAKTSCLQNVSFQLRHRSVRDRKKKLIGL